MEKFSLKHIDWILLLLIAPILGAGLVTMRSFVGETPFFSQQIIWIIISLIAYFTASFFDFRFLKKTKILSAVYLFFYRTFALALYRRINK